MIDIEVERPKFEAWVRGFGSGTHLDNRGRYSIDWVDSAWDGWLARANMADQEAKS